MFVFGVGDSKFPLGLTKLWSSGQGQEFTARLLERAGKPALWMARLTFREVSGLLNFSKITSVI